MQEQKISNKTVVQALSVKISSSSRIITESPEPLEKPPSRWQKFIDLNLKAGKFVLKEGAREAIVESIKWLLGLKRQPAEAGQP